LQQVESAILAAEAASKRSDKGLVPEEVRLGRYLLVNLPGHCLPSSTARETDSSYHEQSLEELAADLGETGLIISLSKPFQRLLKYPLLFQNLLFVSMVSVSSYPRSRSAAHLSRLVAYRCY
jgi:hypothetical protein